MRAAFSLVTAITASVLLQLAGPPALADDTSDEAQIRASAAEWIAAFRAGDIDRLMRLYMPDALVALHGQPALRGVAAIRAYFAPGMGKSDVQFDLAIDEIGIHGSVAHLVSRYWYTAVPKEGGVPYRDAGRSALIYKRDTDGHWKIYLDIDQATPDVTFDNPR